MTEMTPHILFVENAPGFGGSTRMLARLVEMCQSQGWRSSIAARDTTCLPNGLADQNHLIDLRRLRSWRAAERIRRNGDAIIRRTAINQSPIGQRCVGSASFAVAALCGDLPSAVALARIARKRGVTLIHANNDVLANRVAIVAGRLAGVPTISHQRGPTHACLTTRLLARMCNKIIAISHHVHADLCRCGVPDHRAECIYDGVDVCAMRNADDFRLEQRGALGLSDDAFVIGLPAVLAPWKGHGLFLRAFALAAARQTRLHALIVGNAPAGTRNLRTQLEHLAVSLGVAKRVTFAGHMTDMRRAFAAMDVVVHASTLPEPFGLVVAEAMAAGKPVIAANSGGPAEMIRNNVDGCLYPMGDQGALAEAIARLARDPNRRAYLAGNARRRANDFDIHRHQESVANLYRSLHAAKAGQRDAAGNRPAAVTAGA